VKTILNLQSDYSKNGSYIQLSLPINTECLIPVDDSVRLIDQVLEELDYSFKRFLTRGKENVATEYMLLAFAFDLNKLHYRIQSHRIGQGLSR